MCATCRAKMIVLALLCATVWLATPLRAESQAGLVLHEWGTFTVLQDEAGEPLPGVNVNEESLPKFVHHLDSRVVPNSDECAPLRRMMSKGIPQGYPGALMRMETPVIYLYPTSSTSPTTVDVSVQFRGGWITEWFPEARVEAPGFKPSDRSIGTLQRDTTGCIRWPNVTVGSNARLPRTDQHVWIAPRVASAATLSVPNGESEKYLFYRGVANLPAPLRAARAQQRDALSIQFDGAGQNVPADGLTFNALWLVDIRPDGTTAFRKFGPCTGRDGERAALVTTNATFQQQEYSPQRMDELRDSMREALIGEGLFAAEAAAMLNTWKLSYFSTPGMRVFFTLPRAWTDHVLPLEVSRQADIQRVMIGRIELVTPAQRKLLRQIAAGPISPGSWLWNQLERLPKAQVDTQAFYRKLDEGTLQFSEYGIKPPEDYQAFIDLGRFREALVLDELRRRPTSELRRFADQYHLRFMDGVRTVTNTRRGP